MSGRLILCATPIGNLGDAPPRLAEALSGADLIYAEDTRRTATLLRHLGVQVPLRSYFTGNEAMRSGELAAKLADGQTIALVTDAGTPAVSDPGGRAVLVAREAGSEITVIPGPSAVTAALAVSGFGADRFVFEGFLPKKGKERTARVQGLVGDERTIVLFSPTQRIATDLADLAAALGEERPVVVCRELTKLHEAIEHSTLGEAATAWTGVEARGEFTIVIAGAEPAPGDITTALADVAAAMTDGESLSAAVRASAERHGVSRRTLYEQAIQLPD